MSKRTLTDQEKRERRKRERKLKRQRVDAASRARYGPSGKPAPITVTRMGAPAPAPTAEEIEAARTPAGGWTRAQLAAWGVPWPPPKGWRRELLRRSAEDRPALPLILSSVPELRREN